MSTAGSNEFIDYYRLLGLHHGAGVPEIRNAFLQKAKQHHPDAGGKGDTMQLLNAAYKTLMSPSSKAAYDLLHNFHTGATEVSDYKYDDGRNVRSANDMSDAEIDSFLDSVFAEFRNGVPKPEPTIKQRIKKLLDL